VRKRTHRLVALCLIALAAVCGGAAIANVDPASDVLLNDDVFLPFRPANVCPQLDEKVRAGVKAANDGDYPIKVALIESVNDLGGAPQLFGQPQDYAVFLGREIRPQVRATLLIAMPAGFGVIPEEPKSTLKSIEIAGDADSNALARAAIAAVAKLATAHGHPVTAPKVEGVCSTAGTSLLLIVGIPLLLAAVAAALFAARGRRPREPTEPG
jgi:hypothetical protein